MKNRLLACLLARSLAPLLVLLPCSVAPLLAWLVPVNKYCRNIPDASIGHGLLLLELLESQQLLRPRKVDPDRGLSQPNLPVQGAAPAVFLAQLGTQQSRSQDECWEMG